MNPQEAMDQAQLRNDYKRIIDQGLIVSNNTPQFYLVQTATHPDYMWYPTLQEAIKAIMFTTQHSDQPYYYDIFQWDQESRLYVEV